MDIDELLEQARMKSTNYGQLYGEKETADDYLKTKYAELREDAPAGSVTEYQEAIDRKKNAYARWKTAETYMKLLFVQAEVWRTEQANNRFMDKAHQ
jgi:hypothetical protein